MNINVRTNISKEFDDNLEIVINASEYTKEVEFKNNKDEFNNLAKTCMGKDFSWNASANKYIQVYKNLLK